MKQLFAAVLGMAFSLSSKSQNIGIGTATPHPSAALDITDSTKGILIPRMTMAQRNNIQNPAEGLMVYQTDSIKGYWYFDGQNWAQFIDINNQSSYYSSSINYIDTISNLMKYVGDGHEGTFNSDNFTGELSGEHYFDKFIVNQGSTLNLAKNQTIIIHVKDTCFIEGVINGKGRSIIPYYQENTTNRIGAYPGESHGPNGCCQCGAGNNFSWTYSPDGLAYKIGPQIKSTGMDATGLWVASYFLVGIHGFNSANCYNYGYISEGGSGLYIICKTLYFTGTIDLSGGNGPSNNNLGCGGGGGGGLILSTSNIMTNIGIINLSGGIAYCPHGFYSSSGSSLIIKR